MSEPFLGEIRILSFGFAPRGWATCDGQLLPINQNQALFSLLGTMYGGDGRVNFALPDLRGRVSMHVGEGHIQGESAGRESVTLTPAEMPQHTHIALSNTDAGTEASPTGKFWAKDSGDNAVYSTVGGTLMHPNAISTVGGSQPHANLAPLLTLSYCIALQGIFPSRD